MPNRSDERQRGERALRRSGRNSSRIEEIADELQRIDTSGQFTSGLRSARPSTGGLANSRYYETDTRWLYLWNGVAWSNISGIFIGTDADRTAISISATDNGALALTHTSNIYKFYRIESGAWVEKILDVDDEQAQDIVAALLADGDVNFTYNDPGNTLTNVVEKVQGIPYSTVDPTNGQVFQFNSTSGLMEPVDPSTLGSGAPVGASYLTAQAESGLSAEVNLGALTSGMLKHTVSGGVSTPATATEGTDYYKPGGTDVALADGGTGASTASGARTNLGLGTAAVKDVPASGNAASGEVVLGNDTRLSGGGGGAWTKVIKTSDETRNTNNTLTDDAALSFAMAANTNYLIRMHAHYDTNTTPDFKWAITGPASPTALRFTSRNMVAGSSTLNPFTYTTYPTGEIVAGNTGSGSVIIEGFIRNGSNAGTFHFQWAQNTSNGANTSVLAGSYIEYVTF